MLRIVILSYAFILLSLSGCAIGMAALYGAVSGAATYLIQEQLMTPACDAGSHRSGAFCIWENDFESPTKKKKIERDQEVTALARV